MNPEKLRPMVGATLQRMQRQEGRSARGRPESIVAIGSTVPCALPGLLVVLTCCGVLHLSSLNGVFTFDDTGLLQNESLTDFWAFSWFRLTGRPVTTASFAINFTLFGPDAFYCHLGNVIVHVLMVWGVFQVSQCILRSWLLRFDEWASLPSCEFEDHVARLALAVALLYGVHPITTSAVTYIVQRGESLGSVFLILTLWAWTKAFQGNQTVPQPSRGHAQVNYQPAWAALACVFAFAAYGSKEMAAGLPFMLLLFDWQFLRDDLPASTRRSKRILLGIITLPVLVGSVLYVPRIMNPGPTSTIGVGIDGISALGYFAFQPRVFLEYVRLLLLPFNQVIDYGWIPPESTSSKVIGVVAWLGLGILWLFAFLRSRPLGTLCLMTLIWLFPTSTIVPLQDSIFEHRIYLPAAFFVLSMVGRIAVGYRRSLSNGRGISRFTVVTCILAAMLSALTFVRNTEYYDASRLARLELERQPANPRAYASRFYSEDVDDPQLAADLMLTAIQLSEERDYWYAGTKYKWWRELGDLYFFSMNYDAAERAYQNALPESHDDLQRAEVLLQFALIHSIRGEVRRANRRFRDCLEISSRIQGRAQELFDVHLERHGSVEQDQVAGGLTESEQP
ncbi:MAG: tetratricopeptide repeat protein [Planctomycetota bacterium]